MYSKFESLGEEKKKRIIEVSMEEFSQNGYKNASTNNIVKNAEISKGILFHYFKNKKGLFLYVFDYAVDFLTKVIYQRMKDLPSDFFERMVKMGIIKLKVAYEYPVVYKFVIEAVTHASEEVAQEVKVRYQKMVGESMPVLFKDIDTSNFRKDINKDKAMEVIVFALEGVSNKYMKDFKNLTTDEIMAGLETITEEYSEYIEILKKGVLG